MSPSINSTVGIVGRGITLRFVVEDAVPEVTADTVEWYKDNSDTPIVSTSRLMFASDRLSLSINPVRNEDQGTYTIHINHVTGLISAELYMDVQSM